MTITLYDYWRSSAAFPNLVRIDATCAQIEAFAGAHPDVVKGE